MLFHCQKVNFSSSLWNLFFIVAVSEYRNVKERKPGDLVKFHRTEQVLASQCCVAGGTLISITAQEISPVFCHHRKLSVVMNLFLSISFNWRQSAAMDRRKKITLFRERFSLGKSIETYGQKTVYKTDLECQV